MLTVVLLLLLPAVLGMSLMRVVQLPRELWAGRARIQQSRRALRAMALGVLYLALSSYTIVVLMALARALWTPPKTLHDLLAAALVALAYPFVYFAFEWARYHCVEPVAPA